MGSEMCIRDRIFSNSEKQFGFWVNVSINSSSVGAMYFSDVFSLQEEQRKKNDANTRLCNIFLTDANVSTAGLSIKER